MSATVLICDDEAPLRELVGATLGAEGHSIAEASDGEEALERARALRPDLIVLDVGMPRRSGLEVLGELRRDPGLASIPVIMLTARAQVADRAVAAEAGADRYLSKPFSPLELAAVAEELLAIASPIDVDRR